MFKVESSGVINKPLKEVFEYVASPFNGPVFIPNLNENSNIKPQQVGIGQTFNWHFNMSGIDLRGDAEVIGYEYLKNVVIESRGDTSSTWTYTFKEDGKSTKINMAIEYELSDTALNKFANKMVIEKINKKTAEQMIENLKTILED